MQTLFVYVTDLCNRKCTYCFDTQKASHTAVDSYLMIRDLKEILSLYPDGAHSYILTGGEPLLHQNIREFLGVISAIERVFILSNGDLLHTENMSSYEGIGGFILSIKSTTSHYLKKKREQITELKKRGIPVSGIFVLTKQNYQSLPGLCDFMEYTDTSILVQPVYLGIDHREYVTSSFWTMTEGEWQQLDRLMIGYFSLGGRSSYYRFWRSFYHNENVLPPFCPMGTDCFVLDVTGKLLHCFHDQSRQDKFPDCFGEHCLSMFSWI